MGSKIPLSWLQKRIAMFSLFVGGIGLAFLLSYYLIIVKEIPIGRSLIFALIGGAIITASFYAGVFKYQGGILSTIFLIVGLVSSAPIAAFLNNASSDASVFITIAAVFFNTAILCIISIIWVVIFRTSIFDKPMMPAVSTITLGGVLVFIIFIWLPGFPEVKDTSIKFWGWISVLSVNSIYTLGMRKAISDQAEDLNAVADIAFKTFIQILKNRINPGGRPEDPQEAIKILEQRNKLLINANRFISEVNVLLFGSNEVETLISHHEALQQAGIEKLPMRIRKPVLMVLRMLNKIGKKEEQELTIKSYEDELYSTD